jgi:hypothetical protein
LKIFTIFAEDLVYVFKELSPTSADEFAKSMMPVDPQALISAGITSQHSVLFSSFHSDDLTSGKSLAGLMSRLAVHTPLSTIREISESNSSSVLATSVIETIAAEGIG